MFHEASLHHGEKNKLKCSCLMSASRFSLVILQEVLDCDALEKVLYLLFIYAQFLWSKTQYVPLITLILGMQWVKFSQFEANQRMERKFSQMASSGKNLLVLNFSHFPVIFYKYDDAWSLSIWSYHFILPCPISAPKDLDYYGMPVIILNCQLWMW